MIRLVLALVAVGTMTACTSSEPAPPVTSTETITTPPADPTPIDTAPVRATAARACPLLDRSTAADAIGMRLDKVTVLRSGTRVVGCRIYALQGSPLSRSEHLPPANQPAIEVAVARYADAKSAHNAVVLEARAGTEPQQARVHGTTGVCFRIEFFAKDKGRDWACACSVRTATVVVRTVAADSAFKAIQVTRQVRVP